MSSDSPVAVLYDSAGNPIASNSIGGNYHLDVSVAQGISISAGNSSVVNLIAGGSFTGTSVNVLNVSTIRISCSSDTILSISAQQSSDGSNWDVEDSWLAYPNTGTGRSVQVVASYARVVVTNLSPSATTFFRLSTSLCPIDEVLPRSLTEDGTLPLSKQTLKTFPNGFNFTNPGILPSLKLDGDNNLTTRGSVLTDEFSFRDDFTDGAVSVALSGTLTFSSSVYVVGNSTSFLTEVEIGTYIKLDIDSATVLAIVKDVLSNTLLILESAYTGTATSGVASKSRWRYQSGGTGSISYTSTEVSLNSGTTPGSHSSLLRFGDHLPFSLFCVAKINNRYANQESDIGVMETAAYLADKMAAVRFEGTDNTKVKLVTHSDSADKEITEITLPNGGITSDYHEYLLEITAAYVSLWIDKIKVATHIRHIPGPYDELRLVAGIANLGAVSGASLLVVDVVYYANFNTLEIVSKEEKNLVNEHPISSTCSNVAAAVADTQLLASNISRSGATIFNDSTAILYLKLGSGASTTSFTVRLSARDYYELPFGYSGPIYGYWASATGNARITEVF